MRAAGSEELLEDDFLGLVGVQGDHHEGLALLGQLLADDPVGDDVAERAAVLLGDHRPEQPHRGQLRDQLERAGEFGFDERAENGAGDGDIARVEIERIAGLPPDDAELMRLLQPERIRLLPAGAAIVMELARALAAKELMITVRDLRWGVVLGGGTIERGYLADEQESPDSR